MLLLLDVGKEYHVIAQYGIDQILLLRVERRQVLYAIVSVLLDLN